MHKLLSAFPLACYLPAALMLCAAASTWPNAAITVKKHFNSTAAQLRSRDLARIDYLYSQQANDNVDTSRKRQSQTILSAGANSHYTASIGVGNPPTFYSLIVDTGSGNTWVGSTRAYVQTNTSINTGVDVEVPYFYYRGNGNNELFGTEYLDQVTIAPGVTIINQSIGVGLPSWEGDDFVGVDGVLGLGPVDLTIDTLETDNSEVSTVMDNAFSQGLVSQNVIGISLEPIDVNGHFNGEITFGGVDPSRFVGSINWVPIGIIVPFSKTVH
ncbi:Acid protease [Mycena indigotica]|uniref:Acid protease n=1 Tax=Mycena indigotica TaxID=2126181 RepID=A0A8H6VQB4_9AGAR|nr:Acid protease [Mycena indigotica]KAF7289799.1 Acid protease [Mycena indigotica]